MQHKETSVTEDKFSVLYHLLKASPFHDLTNYLKNNEETIKQFLSLANDALDQKTTNINTIPFTDTVCNEVLFPAVQDFQCGKYNPTMQRSFAMLTWGLGVRRPLSTTQSFSNEEQEQPFDDKFLSELKYNFDAMYTLLSSEKNNYRLEAYSLLSDLVINTLGSNHPLILIDYVDQALGNKFIKMKKERDFSWSIDINSETDSISITLQRALFKSQDISWYRAKLLKCGISKENIHFQEKETNNLQGEKKFILTLTNIQVLQDKIKVRSSLNSVKRAEEMLLLSKRFI